MLLVLLDAVETGTHSALIGVGLGGATTLSPASKSRKGIDQSVLYGLQCLIV